MTGQRSLTVVANFTDFNFVVISCKTIFAILCNRQVKQTKSTTGTLHKQSGITR